MPPRWTVVGFTDVIATRGKNVTTCGPQGAVVSAGYSAVASYVMFCPSHSVTAKAPVLPTVLWYWSTRVPPAVGVAKIETTAPHAAGPVCDWVTLPENVARAG